MSSYLSQTRSVAVIGSGPAGLMAAEVLIQAGVQVDLFDSMPSLGRKFLVAGKGGLNLTHAEPREQFLPVTGIEGDRRHCGLPAWRGHAGAVYPLGSGKQSGPDGA